MKKFIFVALMSLLSIQAFACDSHENHTEHKHQSK